MMRLMLLFSSRVGFICGFVKEIEMGCSMLMMCHNFLASTKQTQQWHQATMSWGYHQLKVDMNASHSPQTPWRRSHHESSITEESWENLYQMTQRRSVNEREFNESSITTWRCGSYWIEPSRTDTFEWDVSWSYFCGKESYDIACCEDTIEWDRQHNKAGTEHQREHQHQASSRKETINGSFSTAWTIEEWRKFYSSCPSGKGLTGWNTFRYSDDDTGISISISTTNRQSMPRSRYSRYGKWTR